MLEKWLKIGKENFVGNKSMLGNDFFLFNLRFSFNEELFSDSIPKHKNPQNFVWSFTYFLYFFFCYGSNIFSLIFYVLLQTISYLKKMMPKSFNY